MFGVLCVLFGVLCILFGVLGVLFGVLGVLFGLLGDLFGVPDVWVGVIYFFGIIGVCGIRICICYIWILG